MVFSEAWRVVGRCAAQKPRIGNVDGITVPRSLRQALRVFSDAWMAVGRCAVWGAVQLRSHGDVLVVSLSKETSVLASIPAFRFKMPHLLNSSFDLSVF